MSKIKIISKSYYLCDNENNSWFEENIGSKYAVSEDDSAIYGTDRKFAKNEPMASHLLYTVSGTLESSGKEDSIRPEITGITYGTRYGCMSEVEEAEKKIRSKGERGITPKVFSNTIPCGAASKVAIKKKFRAFNVNNYNGNTGGLDSLIISCEMLREERGVFAVATCGDDECGVYASVLLERSDEDDGSVLVSGYSNGMIYGKDSAKQMKYIIDKAVRVSGADSEKIENVFFIAETDSDKENLETVCKETFKAHQDKVFPFESDNIIYSAKGMLAVMYAENHIKENCGKNAAVIQLGQNNYFSCVILEKQDI